MSVRCGNCKADHGSVADVKSCYGQPTNQAERLIQNDAIRDHLRNKREFAAQEREAEEKAFTSDPDFQEFLAKEALALPVRTGARDGYYTAVLDNGERRTIRLKTQAKDARFAPGEQIASFLSGSDNTNDYTSFAFVKADGKFNLWKRFQNAGSLPITRALEIVLSDSGRAGKEYAIESGNCFVCNRLLTVPESIEKGIGPVCETL